MATSMYSKYYKNYSIAFYNFAIKMFNKNQDSVLFSNEYYPLMFLLRHSLELILKGLVYESYCTVYGEVGSLNLVHNKRRINLGRTHNLLNLLDFYKNLQLDKIFPDYDIITFDNIFNHITQLCEDDLTGENNRYPFMNDLTITNEEFLIKINPDINVLPEIMGKNQYFSINNHSQVEYELLNVKDLDFVLSTFDCIQELHKLFPIEG